MLGCVFAILTLAQRRMRIHFCSPSDSDLMLPITPSSNTIYTQNMYKWTISRQQLTQARERGLVIGTSNEFLDNYIKSTYDHAMMTELRKMYIAPDATLGEFYDKMQNIVGNDAFQYVVLPTYYCEAFKTSPNVFEEYDMDSLADIYASAAYIEAFKRVFVEIFKLRDKSFRQYLSNQLYVDKMQQQRFFILSTPMDFSLHQLDETYITCPITCGGRELLKTLCFSAISIGEISDVGQKDQIRTSDLMVTTLGQAILSSSYADLQAASTTSQVRQMMAQSAKISNINQMIQNNDGTIFQMGRGFGFVNLIYIMRYGMDMSRIQGGMDDQVFHSFGLNNLSFDQVFQFALDARRTYKIHSLQIVLHAKHGNDTLAQFREEHNATTMNKAVLENAMIQLQVVENDHNYLVSKQQNFTIVKRINALDARSPVLMTTWALFGIKLESTYKLVTNLPNPEQYQLSILFATECNNMEVSFVTSSSYVQRSNVLLDLRSLHVGDHYLYYHCVDNGVDQYGIVTKVFMNTSESLIFRAKFKISNQHCRLYFCFQVREEHFSKVAMLGRYCTHTNNYKIEAFGDYYALGVVTLAFLLFFLFEQRHYSLKTEQ